MSLFKNVTQKPVKLPSRISFIILTYIRFVVLCICVSLLSTHGLSIHNKCGEQCKMYRPKESTAAYVLNCDDVTLSERLRAECRLGCQQCPTREVCDHNVKPIKIYCPPIGHIEGVCKRRCDYQRPTSYFGSFSFSCGNETLFPTGWEIRQCHNDCKECATPVCDYLEDVWDCPSVNESEYERPPPPPPEPPYAGRCEYRCNKDRPHGPHVRGRDGTYELVCHYKYSTDATKKERDSCIADCFNCPLDICDAQYDLGVFTCPQLRREPLPDPPKRGTFIVSWTVIGIIAVTVIGCIFGTTLYGNPSQRNDIVGQQESQVEELPELMLVKANERLVIDSQSKSDAGTIETSNSGVDVDEVSLDHVVVSP